MAPALALAAMFCGSEKIPPPIIEPTTRATNAPSLSCFELAAIAISRKVRGTGSIKVRRESLRNDFAQDVID
jgi:hypothetical protein